MATSGIIKDLLFAPYRIGKLNRNKKVFYFFLAIQIPYFIMPGLLLLFASSLYLLIGNLGTLFISFTDLLINSKKYKYLEDKEYSEAYLEMEYQSLEV